MFSEKKELMQIAPDFDEYLENGCHTEDSSQNSFGLPSIVKSVTDCTITQTIDLRDSDGALRYPLRRMASGSLCRTLEEEHEKPEC